MAARHRYRAILQNGRTIWALSLLAAVLFGAANLPWQLDDYDQAKQAFTSFQMVEQGQWFYQNTPRENIATKPPLVGWISAGLFGVVHSWDWAWRLPSILSAAGLAMLLFRLSKSAFGSFAAVISAGAFCFNLLTARLASLVRTDMPLALAVFCVGAIFWRRLRLNSEVEPNDTWLLFLVLTAGMWIKGPVLWAFLVPGLVLFKLWHRRQQTPRLPPVWPWIASFVIFAAWAGWGIRFVPGFYDEVVVREFMGRFGGETHRAQPALFYLPHLLHKFFPWSLLMIGLAAVHLRSADWKLRAASVAPDTAWLICWVAGGLLVMSILPSKRVDRIFPVFAPLCLLLGAQIKRSLKPVRLVESWSAAALGAALMVACGYTGWKIVSGYRTHRAALAEFGREVRQAGAVNGWKEAVVLTPDESLLLYLRKTRFLTPDRAIALWNQGEIDSLVVSTKNAPAITPSLNPRGVVRRHSLHREGSLAPDYLLVVQEHR